MATKVRMEIGGVVFASVCDDALPLVIVDPAYRPFLRPWDQEVLPDIAVDVVLREVPVIEGTLPIFDSGQSWSMYRKGDGYLFCLAPQDLGGMPVLTASFPADVSVVKVCCRKNPAEGPIRHPVSYPLDQILLMHALAGRGGAVLHAAGVEVCGRGYIFPGRSGAGKSTLSRLLSMNEGMETISDDRVVVRECGDGFRLYGTPWPGEEGVARDVDVPLDGIYFIEQRPGNSIGRITADEALRRLMPIISLPLYDRAAVELSLGFCDSLVSRVPAFVLGFAPGEAVVDLLDDFISGG